MKVNFKLCIISLMLTTTYSQATTTEQYVIANKKAIASAQCFAYAKIAQKKDKNLLKSFIVSYNINGDIFLKGVSTEGAIPDKVWTEEIPVLWNRTADEAYYSDEFYLGRVFQSIQDGVKDSIQLNTKSDFSRYKEEALKFYRLANCELIK